MTIALKFCIKSLLSLDGVTGREYHWAPAFLFYFNFADFFVVCFSDAIKGKSDYTAPEETGKSTLKIRISQLD